MHETAISLPVILPEAVLAAGTLALVLYGALRGERGSALVNEIAVGLLGLVFILMVARNRPMGVTFYGSFADDAFTRFMGALALVGSLVTLLLSVEFMRQERIGVQRDRRNQRVQLLRWKCSCLLIVRCGCHLLRLRLLRECAGAQRETNDEYHAMN